MAASARREREVAAFDEGELWCSDEAEPPLSPAGWYFRAPRGTPRLWIGPFADGDEATLAPFSGDALRDARRYLEAWRRGEPPPRLKLAVVRAAPAPGTLPDPQPRLALDGQGDPPARPTRDRRRSRRAKAPTQLSLALDLR